MYGLEERRDAKVDERAEDLIVVSRQIDARLEQLNEIEGERYLGFGDWVALVRANRDVYRAELLRKSAIAVGDGSGTIDPNEGKACVEGERVSERSSSDDLWRERSSGPNPILRCHFLRGFRSSIEFEESRHSLEYFRLEARVARQRNIHSHTRKFQGVAVLDRVAERRRKTEIPRLLDRYPRSVHRCVHPLRDRYGIRHVVEVPVTDKNRVSVSHIGRHDTGRAISGTSIEIGIPADTRAHGRSARNSRSKASAA